MEYFDNCFQEIEKKRKETNQRMNQKLSTEGVQSQIQLIRQELQKLMDDKNNIQDKYQEYLQTVQSIIKENREQQQILNEKEDRLYKIKSNHLNELMTSMPSIGLRHKKILEQEQVDVKIRRYKIQREEKIHQQQVLKGVADQQALPPLSQNPSKIFVAESPKKEDLDNESLAISKSFAQSQIKQSSQKPSSNILLVPKPLQPQGEFRQKGKRQSEFQYGVDDLEDQ